MKFLTRITVLVYVTLIMFLSSFILLFVLNYIDIQSVFYVLTLSYYDTTIELILTIFAGALLCLNFLFYRLFTVNIHKEKTIAFDNPTGRVSVSLVAIEELTKRVISRISEVREVKSRISASKRGLQIKIRLILRAERSIPEVTSRVQELVRKKVQETIGLDEPIEVAIYVGRILPDQEGRSPKKEDTSKNPEKQQNVPFQGYRA